MVGNICLFILLLQEAVCPSCPKMIKYNFDLSITLKERPQPFFILFHWKLPALLTLETLGHNSMSGHKWGSVKSLRTIRSFWTHKWRINSKIKYCLWEPLPVSYHVTTQKCQVWTHIVRIHTAGTHHQLHQAKPMDTAWYTWVFMNDGVFTVLTNVPALGHAMVYSQERCVSSVFGLHWIRMLHFKNAFWVTDVSFI